jgi:hypothetical protein
MADQEPESPPITPTPVRKLATPSPDQVLEALLKKLREVRGVDIDVKCPICHRDSWTVAEMSEVRIYEPERLGKEVYPVIPTICNTCGYTMFFNAIALGLKSTSVSDDEEEEEGASDDQVEPDEDS